MSAMPKRKKEKDVKHQIKKVLDKHDWYWWMPPSNAFGRTGISDFHAVKAGMFIAIEAKFGTNTVTEMQRAFLNSIRAADHFAFVVTDQNVRWLDSFLSDLDASIGAVGKGDKPTPEQGAGMLNAIKALTDALDSPGAAEPDDDGSEGE